MSDQENPTSTPDSKAPDTHGFCGWGTLPQRGENKTEGKRNDKFIDRLFLKETEKGNPYRLRVLGDMFRICRHFSPIRAISPGEEKDVCWQAGNIPKDRYTILAMDRNNDSKFVLLEAGISVFREFDNYFELSNGKSPGGESAPDWVIKVVVPLKKGKDGKMFKDKRSTEYKVMRDEIAPLTAEEIERINTLAENGWTIQKANAPTTPEVIAEMFEQAKVRKDGEPIPGSGAWWKARREAEKASEDDSGGDSGGSSDSSPSEPFEDGAPAGESDSVNTGFDDMFSDSSDDESTDY